MGDAELLWQQYSQHRSPRVREALIEGYAGLARYVVDRMNLRPGAGLDYDDLVSEAVVGLIDAVDRFDPSRGIKFETYAYHRIRGTVIDMLRSLDWLPRSVRQREAKLADASAKLSEEFGRSPTDEEVAEELGLTLSELDTITAEAALQSIESLDDTLAAEDSEVGTLGDLIADETTPSPEATLERGAERDLVAQAADSLPDAERTVIALYYHQGLTLKQIGRVLGVSESRTCQIHGKAIIRMREHVNAFLALPDTPAIASRSFSTPAPPTPALSAAGRWAQAS
ncbi:MAG: sigma-70 family RNA polymerase sigma factor [Armatimonadota bacterium]